MLRQTSINCIIALSVGIFGIGSETITANPSLTPGVWKNITPSQINPSSSFGCYDIKVLPSSPSVLYLTTDVQGEWKSTDAGSTWTEIGASSLGSNPSPGVMQIDPKNPLHMYLIGGVRGSSLGFWVSNDGGATWAQPAGFTAQANNSVGGWVNDVYEVAADPADFKHVLLSFHASWEWSDRSGILESTDGGNSWIRHYPLPLTGAGWTVWFLKGNGGTWLVGTQYDGYWRTQDSGSTWTQVSTQEMQHGGTAICWSHAGVLYVGALSRIMRSTDNGLTFTLVAPSTSDGYYAILSDGNYLYTCRANTGGASTAPVSYLTSPDNDGITWTPYKNGAQTFSDGPYRMVFDTTNRIIYSSNWGAGLWALKVEGNAAVSVAVPHAAQSPAGIGSHLLVSHAYSSPVVTAGKGAGKIFDISGKALLIRK